MNRRNFLGVVLKGGLVSISPAVASRAMARNSRPVELEIIASSIEDAVAAFEGGASRLEVAVRLDQGGLTPPQRMVEDIARHVPIPARVMLRENSGFELTGKEELEKLKAGARAFAKLRVDGLITGYVKSDKLDLDALRQITAAEPPTRFTFHNAIEMTKDPLEALRALRFFHSVDRALVTGGKGSLSDRMKRLPLYEQALGPRRRIELGGPRLDDLEVVLRLTDIRTIHLGLGVRTPETPQGAVDIKKVRAARRMVLA